MLNPTKAVTKAAGVATPRDCVTSVLERKTQPRIVYAPNYWQWFAHHPNHGLLPRNWRIARPNSNSSAIWAWMSSARTSMRTSSIAGSSD